MCCVCSDNLISNNKYIFRMAPEVIVCETIKDNPYDYKVRKWINKFLMLQCARLIFLWFVNNSMTCTLGNCVLFRNPSVSLYDSDLSVEVPILCKSVLRVTVWKMKDIVRQCYWYLHMKFLINNVSSYLYIFIYVYLQCC